MNDTTVPYGKGLRLRMFADSPAPTFEPDVAPPAVIEPTIVNELEPVAT